MSNFVFENDLSHGYHKYHGKVAAKQLKHDLFPSSLPQENLLISPQGHRDLLSAPSSLHFIEKTK